MVIPPDPHPPDPGGIKSLNAISFEHNPDNSILFEDFIICADTPTCGCVDGWVNWSLSLAIEIMDDVYSLTV